MGMRTIKRRKNIITYVIIAFVIFFVNLPIVSMIGTALKGGRESLSSWALLPEHPVFTNFIDVLKKTTFLTNMLNSFIVATTVTVTCIFVATLAGYAISRFKSPILKSYSIFLLIMQMFPGILLLIPLFTIFNSLKMIDTRYSVFLAYVTLNLPFSIWMLKGFIDTLPLELEESAFMDGCGYFKSYYRIILPLSIPGISTVAIFTFLNCWNEYMLASIFLRSEEMIPLSVALKKYMGQYRDSDYSGLMAASTLATIPTIIFLVFTQRYLIQGLTAGAVKG